ncbi:MAG: glycoside hydrolase family 9 protein [Ignavibacteriales bacterium]|nr:MAG: cellulase [Ignavibacteriaceae bacterium]MBW7872012.1 glycoside hydrolase family 9 protein [Ignavibacteria bacterium]MBZ0197279.1 glycoside hydrolase family 9 protein [Ignavibacteriaceae bacterium]MCZ2144108.1 glycoside hydrolase family 9 protein [Ignavibacteriales bacterium]WKZ72894.1 MAG: glycoside hydrolase family 9 protein [Ignavibacteriaceae bacterium]
MRKIPTFLFFIILTGFSAMPQSVIRTNLLGYQPKAIKVAVLMSESEELPTNFNIENLFTGEIIEFTAKQKPTEANETGAEEAEEAEGAEEADSKIPILVVDSTNEQVKTAKEQEITNIEQVKTNNEHKGKTFKTEIKPAGALGNFKNTARLNFSQLTEEGVYRIHAGGAVSSSFIISDTIYNSTADFILNYMRQQRCGYNPFLKDSCHTHDGFAIYTRANPQPDSVTIEKTPVSDFMGGWHDASDYLRYATTSATVVYQLLFAYQRNPRAFSDQFDKNGDPGSNGIPDVLDEAKWGLDWLNKLYPGGEEMYQQVADDRDHQSFRLPTEDSVKYRNSPGRPVYGVTGTPQGLFAHKSRSTGVASIAGKFASAMSLGAEILGKYYPEFAGILSQKAAQAYEFGLKYPGYSQTAPGRAPYFYEEENWADDMELAAAQLYRSTGNKKYLEDAVKFGKMEPVTPWIGADTAAHYQWYPFINLGHSLLFETTLNSGLQQNSHPQHPTGENLNTNQQPQESDNSIPDSASGAEQKFNPNPQPGENINLNSLPPENIIYQNSKEFAAYYQEGLEKLYQRGIKDPFFIGIPFIWCSNNLISAAVTQAYLYKIATNDEKYSEMEAAHRDWLFGCNPWGTSMIVGLPSWGDNPSDPHSAFTHVYNFPINGGLVDGPIYSTIYQSLIGIHLAEPDEYERFQPGRIVYHDDWGDYSTNEPTHDGTAGLAIYLSSLFRANNLENNDSKTNGLQNKDLQNDSSKTNDFENNNLDTNELKNNDLGNKNNTPDSLFPAPKTKNLTFFKGGLIRLDSTKREIALVFTGHEFANGAETIIKTLDQFNAKGNFFFTGDFYRNPEFADIVKRLKSKEHYLGAHSDRHILYNSWENRDSTLVTRQQFEEDVVNNYREMAKFGISKEEAPYFLPSFEWFNEEIAVWANGLGLKLVNFTPGTKSNQDWTIPSGDYYFSSDSIFNSITQFEEKSPNGMNGFILLTHFGTHPERKDNFFEKLYDLLLFFKEKGYNFVKL